MAVAGLMVLVVTTGVASAHAVVTASAPADDEQLDHAPSRVEVGLDAKPATTEGDPIAVFDPHGRRVDLGDARTEDGGKRLGVSLAATELPAGTYQVVYRIVSADSHVVFGRFSFTARNDRPPGADGLPPPAVRVPVAGRVRDGRPTVVAFAFAAVAARAVARRVVRATRQRSHRTERGPRCRG